MSPPALEMAETLWLSQLTAMREALAELKLPPTASDGSILAYGQDIILDDDEVSGPSGSDDPWDFYSDGEDVESGSSQLNGIITPPLHGGDQDITYGPQWLEQKCLEFASRSSGMSADDLQSQVRALLASSSDGMWPLSGTRSTPTDPNFSRNSASVELDRCLGLR